MDFNPPLELALSEAKGGQGGRIKGQGGKRGQGINVIKKLNYERIELC